jgi:hypothetical protein
MVEELLRYESGGRYLLSAIRNEKKRERSDRKDEEMNVSLQ